MISKTLDEIKIASSNKNEATFLLKYFRQLGFYISWVFLRLRLTPMQVTYFNFVLGIYICISFATFDPMYRIFSSILLLLWQILDTVDGNMARVLNKRSNYGGFIDYAGNMFIVAFLHISIGFGLYRYPEGLITEIINNYMQFDYLPAYTLILSAYSSVATILCRLLHKVIQIRFGRIMFKEVNLKVQQLSLRKIIIHFIQNIERLGGMQIIIIFITSIIGCLEITIFFYFLLNIIMLAGYTIHVFWSLRKLHFYPE